MSAATDPTAIGPYDILRKLGEGGMGRVFLARHRVLGREAVVKQILPALATNADLVRRFFIEAQAAARLEHRNVVAIHDCQTTHDGVPYIVLEYLRGLSLKDWIEAWVARTGARVPSTYAAIVLVQAANALDAAHDAGIIHRDIKPENLFLTHAVPPELHARLTAAGLPTDLHVKVLDFGIAKLVEAHGGAGTGTGIGIGTPAFMAPEQLASAKDVDRRADIYSLGAVAYQLLTGGQFPWGAATPPVQIYQRQHAEPAPDPRQSDPSIAPNLAAVVRKAMACAPSDRWPTVGAFARAFASAVAAEGPLPGGIDLLQAYAPELGVASADALTLGRVDVAPAIGGPSTAPLPPALVPTPRPTGGHAASASTPTTLGSSVSVSSANVTGRGSRRGLVVALGAVGVAVAGLALVITLSGGGSSSAPSPAAAAPIALDAGPIDGAPIDASAPIVDAAPPGVVDAGSIPVDAAPPVDARPSSHRRPPKPAGDGDGSARGFRDLTK